MKIEEKLKITNNRNEELIANFLLEKAKEDSELLEAIENNDNKNISKCWNYIYAEAKKLLNNQSGALEDHVVYDLAVKYFKEHEEANNNTKSNNTSKKEKSKEKENLNSSNKNTDDKDKKDIIENKVENSQKEVLNNAKEEVKTTSFKIEKVGNQIAFNLD